ncbi:hypothetical protein ABEB36_009191 [Hypothenemus hampei]|uniref:Uncharacterized protein n=1 Tax=Hypothenemus hampei TaxID=57062 RepID=A0ABD1EPY5_HYPHA
MTRNDAKGDPELKLYTEKVAPSLELPRAKFPVVESIRRRPLISTRRAWWLRMSAPIIAFGTAAIQKCHRIGRRRSRSISRYDSPKVSIWEKMAATSLSLEGETLILGFAGNREMSAPVSIKNV